MRHVIPSRTRNYHVHTHVRARDSPPITKRNSPDLLSVRTSPTCSTTPAPYDHQAIAPRSTSHTYRNRSRASTSNRSETPKMPNMCSAKCDSFKAIYHDRKSALSKERIARKEGAMTGGDPDKAKGAKIPGKGARNHGKGTKNPTKGTPYQPCLHRPSLTGVQTQPAARATRTRTRATRTTTRASTRARSDGRCVR